MASKKQIDDFYSNNYHSIYNDTKQWVEHCQASTADAEDYISNSYEFVLANKDKIGEREIDIKNYAYRFIIDNVKWYNSSTNKDNRRINNGEYELIDNILPSLNIEDESYNMSDNEDYTRRLMAIEIYNQKASKEDRIVYHVYSAKEKRTVRALGSHLNIKNTQSWIKITEMKTGIKEIYRQLKNTSLNKNI